MTQKELLYVEDAIGHETNMISIMQDAVSNMQDKNLVSFVNKELKKHKSMLAKLMSMLEDKSNE